MTVFCLEIYLYGWLRVMPGCSALSALLLALHMARD
jgi:hypothetical protein